jgi:hypothetical protein
VGRGLEAAGDVRGVAATFVWSELKILSWIIGLQAESKKMEPSECEEVVDY